MTFNTPAKVLFIINPKAGNRKKDELPALIKRYIDPGKITFEVHYSSYKGHGALLAQHAIAAGNDVIVAVGGDGTVNEIAGALVGSSAALGIVPFGSGNGLARHLKLPMGLATAIKRLNNLESTCIDAAFVNGEPFFCTSGIGFDAHIGQLFASSDKRGFGTYFQQTLKEFYRYKPKNYTLEINGNAPLQRDAFLVTIANAGQYGNEAYIAPEADISDGLLDVCILKPFAPWKALYLGPSLFTKTIHYTGMVEVLRATKLKIHKNGSACLHLDGEHKVLEGDLNYEIRPQALRVIV